MDDRVDYGLQLLRIRRAAGKSRRCPESPGLHVEFARDCGLPGQYITIYLTGQGQVDHAVATGAPAPVTGPFSQPLAPVTAAIAGQPALVQFAGLAPGFVGLLQVNLQLPESAVTGEQRLEVTIGDTAAPPAVVSIGPRD